MSLSRGVMVITIVAALVTGAATMAACSGDDAADANDGGTGSSIEATGTMGADETSATASDGPASDDPAGAASSAGSLDEEELLALEAELEAMESELGSLALPENDFGDIEALLD